MVLVATVDPDPTDLGPVTPHHRDTKGRNDSHNASY